MNLTPRDDRRNSRVPYRRPRRVSAGISRLVAVGGLGLLLTGCVSVGRVADASELPGQWYSSQKPSIMLDLGADGVLSAKAWPEGIGCSSDWTADDLAGMNRLDLDGQWSWEDLPQQTQIHVRLDTRDCGFPAAVRRRSDDVYICVFVAAKDPDSLSEDETLPFARSPELAEGAGDVCLR